MQEKQIEQAYESAAQRYAAMGTEVETAIDQPPSPTKANSPKTIEGNIFPTFT